MYKRVFKRLLDILCALAALIVFCWLFAIVAVLVRVKLGSPVIFRQPRPGLDGRVFTLRKFRTMTDERDEHGELLPDEVRLTRFGRFLRSTSLDELPEAWNILVGDMSVVGPRPLLVQYLPLYNEHQSRRHEVRPGLSGWAQVNGRNALSWEQKFDLDVWYVDHVSLWLDIKIVWMTIVNVVKRDGINGEGSATMEPFTGIASENGESHHTEAKISADSEPTQTRHTGVNGVQNRAAEAINTACSGGGRMNILFLTLIDFDSYSQKGLYTDLLRALIADGHTVCTISPAERRTGKPTRVIEESGGRLVKLRIGNVQKTNIIEKGISTVMLNWQFRWAIDRFLSDVHFDLVLYSTPPIMYTAAVKYIKQRDGAQSYLLLKDIFPQNAVDLGMMSASGPLYRYFRAKERTLYALSDRIGCMSQANVDYVLRHNPQVAPERVHVSPNTEELYPLEQAKAERPATRERYGLPENAVVFVYGGNLGKPQDIAHLVACLRQNADRDDRFFVISGTGTEFHLLEEYLNAEQPANVLLINGLERSEYQRLVAACDVGLIFLNHRFTIPNFPSRLLTYMQCRLPVLACTDPNTDIGAVICEGGFGWWCESDSADAFTAQVDAICAQLADLAAQGERAWEFFRDNYTSAHSREIILNSLGD